MLKLSRAQIKDALRGNVELEQALIRCVLLSLVTLYLWTYQQSGPHIPDSPRLASLAYLIISIPVFIWIIAKPGQHHPRRIAFTVLDQAMTAFAVSFGGHSIPIIAIAFWVMVGSGFRFGNAYLYLSAGTAVLGILYNMAFSPQWAGYLFVGWGYLISILVVALYTTALLARVTETNRKLNESLNHLNNLAHIDSLTGLPNRLAIVERLTQAIAKTKRQRTYVSLLYFDLDGFKAINDTFGHNQGDELLKEVAQRVAAKIRNIDALARIGGDEFIIMLENIHVPQEATHVATIILDTLREIEISGLHPVTGTMTTLHIGASIGIASYGSDSSPCPLSVDELIQRADDAMYMAKQAGKGCYRFWYSHSA